MQRIYQWQRMLSSKRCKRVGRFSHTRPRPVSVEFEHIQDVEIHNGEQRISAKGRICGSRIHT